MRLDVKKVCSHIAYYLVRVTTDRFTCHHLADRFNPIPSNQLDYSRKHSAMLQLLHKDYSRTCNSTVQTKVQLTSKADYQDYGMGELFVCFDRLTTVDNSSTTHNECF